MINRILSLFQETYTLGYNDGMMGEIKSKDLSYLLGIFEGSDSISPNNTIRDNKGRILYHLD